MKNTLQQQLDKLQENKVSVAPNAYIVRHQLVYSGKGENAIVMTPIDSRALAILMKQRKARMEKQIEEHIKEMDPIIEKACENLASGLITKSHQRKYQMKKEEADRLGTRPKYIDYDQIKRKNMILTIDMESILN